MALPVYLHTTTLFCGQRSVIVRLWPVCRVVCRFQERIPDVYVYIGCMFEYACSCVSMSSTLFLTRSFVVCCCTLPLGHVWTCWWFSCHSVLLHSRCTLLCPALHVFWGFKLYSSCMHSKHFTHQVFFPVQELLILIQLLSIRQEPLSEKFQLLLSGSSEGRLHHMATVLKMKQHGMHADHTYLKMWSWK